MSKKLLVISPHYYPENFRVNDITKDLVKEGMTVTVLTGLPNYPEGHVPKEYKYFRNHKEVIEGVNVIRVPIIGRGKKAYGIVLNYLSYLLNVSFYALFMKKDFDLVYVFNTSPVFVIFPALVVKWIKKIPVYTYVMDIWPESLVAIKMINETNIFFPLIKKMSHWLYRKSNHIIVSSKSFVDYFKEIGITKNVHYWPQYSKNIFNQYPSKGYDPEYENESFKILFAGNVTRVQNLQGLIEIIPEVDDKIELYIVGDGMDREYFQEQAKNISPNRIKFLGRKKLEEMPYYYSKADLLFVGLEGETIVSSTLPARLYTCLLAQKPILGFGGSEVKRVIEEADVGIFANNKKELIHSINEILRNYTRYMKKVDEKSFVYYKKHFDEKYLRSELYYLLSK